MGLIGKYANYTFIKQYIVPRRGRYMTKHTHT